MKRLKFDNYTSERVCRLVKWHGLKYFPEEASVRRALNRVGRDIFDEFIRVQRADISAKNPKVVPDKLELLKKKEAVYREIIRRGDCFEVKTAGGERKRFNWGGNTSGTGSRRCAGTACGGGH